MPNQDVILAGEVEQQAWDENLSAQEVLFVDAWLSGQSMHRAAITAGYTTNPAQANRYGTQLLSRPYIKEAVKLARKEYNRLAEVDPVRVRRRLDAMASVTPKDFVDSKGRQLALQELPDQVAIGVQSWKVSVNDHGEMSIDIRLVDKKGIEAIIARIVGLDKGRTDLEDIDYQPGMTEQTALEIKRKILGFEPDEL